jgi:hypothetical protein
MACRNGLLLLACLIAACTSFQSIDQESTAAAVAELKVGDTLEVVTQDGGQLRLTIDTITDQEVIGSGLRVAKSDIRSVRKDEIDAGKTLMTAVTVFGVIASIGLLILVMAL